MGVIKNGQKYSYGFNGRPLICIFSLLASIPKPGDTCLAVGWGITDAETTPVEVADTLQEVEVPILNNCTKRYSNASMYICGGFAEGGKDSCQGMYIIF